MRASTTFTSPGASVSPLSLAYVPSSLWCRDMFSVPNQKGMEVVFHYLFSQLDQQQCYEEFRDCWPVFDKKQEQIFRKKCCIWLADIAKVCC